MTRWSPNFTKEQVLTIFHQRLVDNPRLTSFELAEELGCEPSYVRATLRRAGVKLPRAHRKPKVTPPPNRATGAKSLLLKRKPKKAVKKSAVKRKYKWKIAKKA